MSLHALHSVQCFEVAVSPCVKLKNLIYLAWNKNYQITLSAGITVFYTVCLFKLREHH
jgi:hypothetical protein